MINRVEARVPNTNTGHGHVWERADGVRVRCGGPGLCTLCASDSVRHASKGNASAEVIYKGVCIGGPNSGNELQSNYPHTKITVPAVKARPGTASVMWTYIHVELGFGVTVWICHETVDGPAFALEMLISEYQMSLMQE